jgi:hypothetical protein
LNIVVIGSVAFQIQHDDFWMMATSQIDTLPRLGRLQDLYAASLQCRAQHFSSVFRLVNDQNAWVSVSIKVGEHERTSMCGEGG